MGYLVIAASHFEISPREPVRVNKHMCEDLLGLAIKAFLAAGRAEIGEPASRAFLRIRFSPGYAENRLTERRAPTNPALPERLKTLFLFNNLREI
jgi:hypothetical protein